MGSDTSFLITVLYGDTLLRCALKVSNDSLKGDVAEFPMEPENRDQLHKMLPLHVRECGPIVDVQSIFEIHTH